MRFFPYKVLRHKNRPAAGFARLEDLCFFWFASDPQQQEVTPEDVEPHRRLCTLVTSAAEDWVNRKELRESELDPDPEIAKSQMEAIRNMLETRVPPDSGATREPPSPIQREAKIRVFVDWAKKRSTARPHILAFISSDFYGLTPGERGPNYNKGWRDIQANKWIRIDEFAGLVTNAGPADIDYFASDENCQRSELVEDLLAAVTESPEGNHDVKGRPVKGAEFPEMGWMVEPASAIQWVRRAAISGTEDKWKIDPRFEDITASSFVSDTRRMTNGEKWSKRYDQIAEEWQQRGVVVGQNKGHLDKRILEQLAIEYKQETNNEVKSESIRAKIRAFRNKEKR